MLNSYTVHVSESLTVSPVCNVRFNGEEQSKNMSACVIASKLSTRSACVIASKLSTQLVCVLASRLSTAKSSIKY